MDKALRKCYEYLELSYDATEEDVITRQNAMIKILHSKRNYKNNIEEKINRVKNSADAIIKNIKLNGMPVVKQPWFETKNETLVIQLIVLFFVGLIFVASLVAIL